MMIPNGYTFTGVEAKTTCVRVIAHNGAQQWACVVAPNDDISGFPAEAQSAISAARTPEMADAHAATVIPEPELTEADYAAAVQAAVDATARARGYQNGFALASYATSTIPSWAAEATTFIAWRDAVWVYAHQALAEVQAQTRPQPTVSELVAELPAISWPS